MDARLTMLAGLWVLCGCSRTEAPTLRRSDPPPCGAAERGEAQAGHEFVGRTIAQLERQGGRIVCGGAARWQLAFGTHCGDRASSHEVVTVELSHGRVRRVWTREQYNDAFCGEPDP